MNDIKFTERDDEDIVIEEPIRYPTWEDEVD